MIPIKKQADDALKKMPSVENVIVFKRAGEEIPWRDERDHWCHALCDFQSPECETEKLDANAILYFLYTSRARMIRWMDLLSRLRQRRWKQGM